MRLLMLGLNHRTAPIELRERVAVADAQQSDWLRQARATWPTSEIAMLSTCNRTELYIARPSHDPPDHDTLLEHLAHTSGIDRSQLNAVMIRREQAEVIRHLFRVATGLESMVLGEPQILGQVKRAYEAAQQADTIGPALHRVFQQAITTSKLARRQTRIGDGATSVGSVAIQFARQIFEHFDDKTVLSIGAGEMTKVMLRRLSELSPGRLCVVNRTASRAQEIVRSLGRPNEDHKCAEVRAWEDREELLVEADVLLTCTGSSQAIITAKSFGPIARKRRHRPLFILDLAVPRDVEEVVGTFSNVYLYNLDDLQEAASGNAAQRGEAMRACEALIADRVETCMSEMQHADIGRLVKALRNRLSDIGEAESQRTRRKLATFASNGNEQELAHLMDEHTRRLINKILHLPLSQLDHHDRDAPLGFYAAALRRLFDLEETSHIPETAPPRGDER